MSVEPAAVNAWQAPQPVDTKTPLSAARKGFAARVGAASR